MFEKYLYREAEQKKIEKTVSADAPVVDEPYDPLAVLTVSDKKALKMMAMEQETFDCRNYPRMDCGHQKEEAGNGGYDTERDGQIEFYERFCRSLTVLRWMTFCGR